MGALIFIAIAVVLAGPILAIMALLAVRRLEGDPSHQQIPQLISRIYALEKRISELEQAVQRAPSVGGKAEPVFPKPIEKPATEPLSEQVRVKEPAPSAPASESTAPPPAPIAGGQGGDRPFAPVQQVSNVSSDATLRVPYSHAAPVDLENRIAGNWFNRIGIVAILIAISSGLKWAFDNNVIGPSGRVAIGVLLGALMLPWSQWLLGKGYRYFSEGIAALGEATLFLSVWAGCQYYTLYSRDVGFAAMIVITAVMAAVAVGRDSQRIAVLSLLGGLLTPILASSGQDQQVILFSYLIVLGLGTLAIDWKKDWKSLLPIAFIGTQIYFWGWYSEFFHRASPLERTVAFATLFFFLYAALPLAKALRGQRVGVILSGGNADPELLLEVLKS